LCFKIKEDCGVVWCGWGWEWREVSLGKCPSGRKLFFLLVLLQDQDFTGDAKLQGKDPPPPEDAMATLRACTPV
jgi:hypothetical protein